MRTCQQRVTQLKAGDSGQTDIEQQTVTLLRVINTHLQQRFGRLPVRNNTPCRRPFGLPPENIFYLS